MQVSPTPPASPAPIPSSDLPKRAARLPTGITMAYIEVGPVDGQAVVMLHGITDTARSFVPTIEALRARNPGLRLIAVDLRGHGASSLPDDAGVAAAPERGFALAALAADVLALLDHLGVATAHVVGHSFGSLVAQELALDRPDRITSVTLIGATASGVGTAITALMLATIDGWRATLEARRGLRWPEDAYRMTPADVGPAAVEWLRENWVAEPTAPAAHVAAILPETAATPLGTWLGGFRVLALADLRDRLATLSVPALVLWASQDAAFPADDQRDLCVALDAAVSAGQTRYVYKTYGKQPLPHGGAPITELGHNTQWGAPATVAADIDAFLRTGRPTEDLPYADPADPQRVLVDEGAALVLECSPAAVTGS